MDITISPYLDTLKKNYLCNSHLMINEEEKNAKKIIGE
jgi:hypothetical protein